MFAANLQVLAGRVSDRGPTVTRDARLIRIFAIGAILFGRAEVFVTLRLAKLLGLIPAHVVSVSCVVLVVPLCLDCATTAAARATNIFAETVATITTAPTGFASAALTVSVTRCLLTVMCTTDLQVFAGRISNRRPLVSTLCTPRRSGAIGAILFSGTEVREAFANTKCLGLVPVHGVFVALFVIEPRGLFLPAT